MRTRLELQSKLEELFGNDHVYYQPTVNLKMVYPAITYDRSRINIQHANNHPYHMNYRYDITVISNRPDHPVILKILELPYTSYDRQYKSNNLYHDVITLYL